MEDYSPRRYVVDDDNLEYYPRRAAHWENEASYTGSYAGSTTSLLPPPSPVRERPLNRSERPAPIPLGPYQRNLPTYAFEEKSGRTVMFNGASSRFWRLLTGFRRINGSSVGFPCPAVGKSQFRSSASKRDGDNFQGLAAPSHCFGICCCRWRSSLLFRHKTENGSLERIVQ